MELLEIRQLKMFSECFTYNDISLNNENYQYVSTNALIMD